DPPYVRTEMFGADFDVLATAPVIKTELLKTFPESKDDIEALFNDTERIEFNTTVGDSSQLAKLTLAARENALNPFQVLFTTSGTENVGSGFGHKCFYDSSGGTSSYSSFMAWIGDRDFRGKEVIEFLAALLDLLVAGFQQHQQLQAYITNKGDGDLSFILQNVDVDEIVLGNASDSAGPTPILRRKIADFIEELAGAVTALAAQNLTSAVTDLSTPRLTVPSTSASTAKGKGKQQQAPECPTSQLFFTTSLILSSRLIAEYKAPKRLAGWKKSEAKEKSVVKAAIVKVLKLVLDESQGQVYVQAGET
ncbi:hypothetical protein JCM5350_000429, partial [Sporobolomyces pararoseus]